MVCVYLKVDGSGGGDDDLLVGDGAGEHRYDLSFDGFLEKATKRETGRKTSYGSRRGERGRRRMAEGPVRTPRR